MKSAKDNNSLIKTAIVILTCILVVSLLLMLSSIIGDKLNKPFSGSEITTGLKETLTDGSKTYKLKDDISTFLILGLDKFEEDTGDETSYYNYQQCDFLLLLVIDNETQTCNAVQINRDTMTEVNVLGVAGQKVSSRVEQIALSHTYGNGELVSCRNSADAVSNLLKGVTIDHFLSVTMDAVPVVNDAVGGVEVEIKDDFSSVDESLVIGTTVTLSGEQALKYVRARGEMAEPTNLARMERQRVYMNGLFTKLRENTKDNSGFSGELFQKLSEYITSNCTSAQLENIFNNISGYDFGEIITLDGEAREGEKYMEFYPDSDSIEKVIIDLFYTQVQ